MTPPTLAQLRAIAEKATSGPWANHEEHGFPYVLGPDDELLGGPVTIVDGAENLSIEDAAHIAAFNPARCIALLDRIERLEKLLANPLTDKGLGALSSDYPPYDRDTEEAAELNRLRDSIKDLSHAD